MNELKEILPLFSEIYTRYYKSSFLFVKSYVHDDMAAEDITSEALINLWQTSKKETVEHPHALLVLILKNEALNYLKHEVVKQVALETIASGMTRDINYRIATLEACDPQELFSAEITEIVKKTLHSLPEQTRHIFEMSRYEHLSVKEIAETLKISPKSVEYHITQSLKALRATLKEYLPLFFFLFRL
ncbi:RNA polymerase sigma-70 factor [Bacteroidia bacterium]|nr:RNA polymerase sigma-70 factor [Bacteroidia bacterium]GHU75928.1 RNA polymerase sigma-70 factor [Bacteroidia bacterium]